jgi:hypothetical protein
MFFHLFLSNANIFQSFTPIPFSSLSTEFEVWLEKNQRDYKWWVDKDFEREDSVEVKVKFQLLPAEN